MIRQDGHNDLTINSEGQHQDPVHEILNSLSPPGAVDRTDDVSNPTYNWKGNQTGGTLVNASSQSSADYHEDQSSKDRERDIVDDFDENETFDAFFGSPSDKESEDDDSDSYRSKNESYRSRPPNDSHRRQVSSQKFTSDMTLQGGLEWGSFNAFNTSSFRSVGNRNSSSHIGVPKLEIRRPAKNFCNLILGIIFLLTSIPLYYLEHDKALKYIYGITFIAVLCICHNLIQYVAWRMFPSIVINRHGIIDNLSIPDASGCCANRLDMV
eukprot:UN31549